MLAEILHALIDAAGGALADNLRGELHALADKAEADLLRKALPQEKPAAGRADGGAAPAV